MASVQSLFEPFSLKGLQLKSRVVMAPMTRAFAPNGVPVPDMAGYYRRRAEGGVGLIVTEAVGISRPTSLNETNLPRFHGDDALSVWKDVVTQVHAAGGLIAPQLWHVGAVPGKAAIKNIDSPSGLFSSSHEVGLPMTDNDIADTITAYAEASASARELGFDAVEFHAAHGYLIDQFFWGETNLRSDGYGGQTLAERSRFACEVLKASRRAVGPDFPLIIRLSQWKQQNYEAKLAFGPKEMEQWLLPLADAGADIFHCSQRRYWEPEFEGSPLNLAGWAKKITGRPSITVGSVGLSGEFMASDRGEGSKTQPIDNLLKRLATQEFDLVAVGRALLDDPEWLQKVGRGEFDKLRAYDPAAMKILS